MKTLILNTIFFCFSFFRQEEPLSTIIHKPIKSIKLSKADFQSYSKKKNNYASLIKNAKNIYKSEGILIGFEDKAVARNPMSLTEMKEQMLSDGEEMQVRGGTVDIIKIKNNKYLIFKQNDKHRFSYTFYSETRDNKFIEGSVIFN